MLARLRAAARRLSEPDSPIEEWLYSGLATGADQFAASSAHAQGYKVHAVLPFAASLYREDFAPGAEREEFERQLAAAEAVTALPCARDGSDDGYVMAGKTIVAAADAMIAVWDGDATENADGGTAYVVALAIDAGVPVIHISVDRATARVGPVMLLSRAAPTALESAAAFDDLLRAILV